MSKLLSFSRPCGLGLVVWVACTLPFQAMGASIVSPGSMDNTGITLPADAISGLQGQLPKPGKVWVYTVEKHSGKWVYQAIEPMAPSSVEKVYRKNLRNYPKGEAARLAAHTLELSQRHQFDPAFVLSVIRAESHFDAHAKSSVGATGLMQLMPATAQYVARRWQLQYRNLEDLKDPYKNLSLGITYLAYLRDRYDRLDQFLAAYNAGPGVVDRILKTQKVFQPKATRPYIEKIRVHVDPISRIRVAQLVAPEILDVALESQEKPLPVTLSRAKSRKKGSQGTETLASNREPVSTKNPKTVAPAFKI